MISYVFERDKRYWKYRQNALWLAVYTSRSGSLCRVAFPDLHTTKARALAVANLLLDGEGLAMVSR